MAIFDKQWWMEVLQLNESPPINFERDEFEDYVNQNRDKIEKAAAVFNFPIDDIVFAFTAGGTVILNDDVWSKLQNTKSYKIKSLEDAISHALKLGINPKPYIEFIKTKKELPLPLVLCYGQDKYYLVGGEVVLSLYKALGLIPTVLQGTINMQTKRLPEPMNEEDTVDVDGIKLKDEQIDMVETFIQFAVKELNLKKLPSGLTLSYDTDKARERHTFGTFNPENNEIWLYVKDRNLADILRTLAHELVHRKQAEDDRLEDGSGATGSEIENEANAQAGILLRKFGQTYENIYEGLNEKMYGNYLFGGNDTGVTIGWYDKEKEEDTPEEKEFFTYLKKYADSEFYDYEGISLDHLLPLFQKLKKEYPNVVNPRLNKNDYIYRGTIVDIDKLEELKNDPSAEETRHNIIIPNKKYSSKRKISSWSANYFNAASFAIATAERRKMVPIVMRTKASNAELYFNPEFMNKLSRQPEEEVLNSTNPIPVDIMILKGFDTEMYPEEGD